MPRYINGPTNFAYLKGTINGITKNIYLFMDNHYPLDEQTRCESFDSIDISQYLYKLIKKTKVPLDFFAEIRQTAIKTQPTNKKDIYIKEVNEMFKNEFIIDKTNDKIKDKDKDKVKYSKINPNVRLHYLDVRDHFDLFYITDIIKYDIPKIFDMIFKNIGDKRTHLNKILDFIQIIEVFLDDFNRNIIALPRIPNNKHDKKKDKQKYYLNKIINKYENIELKKNINNFIDFHVKQLMYNLTKYIDDLKSYIKYYDEKNNDKIKKCQQYIYDSSIDLYSLLTDAYLLRRILDKNYITNCIVYSGSQHSVNYMYFLIKYYNFELVTIYRSIEKDPIKLVNLIKKEESVYNIYKYIYLIEKKYLQCLEFYVPFSRDFKTDLFTYPDFDKLFPTI